MYMTEIVVMVDPESPQSLTTGPSETFAEATDQVAPLRTAAEERFGALTDDQCFYRFYKRGAGSYGDGN